MRKYACESCRTISSFNIKKAQLIEQNMYFKIANISIKIFDNLRETMLQSVDYGAFYKRVDSVSDNLVSKSAQFTAHYRLKRAENRLC